MTTELTITRFDIFDRPATENDDERQVVRLFAKRKLMGELDLEDVTRYDEDGFGEDDFKSFIAAKPRTLTDAMDYLGEDAPEEGDEEEEREGGTVVPEKYRVKYGAPQNCGDEIALALTGFVTLPRAGKKADIDGGLDRAKLAAVCEVNGLGNKLAEWQDRGLNGGLMRMNTGNVLRGMNRRGERVQIGDRVWAEREVPKKTRTRAAAKPKAAKAKAAKKK